MQITEDVQAALVAVHKGQRAWQVGIDLLLDTTMGLRIASDVVNPDDGTVQLDNDCLYLSSGELWLWEIIRSLLGYNEAKPALDLLDAYDIHTIVGAALARAAGIGDPEPRWV